MRSFLQLFRANKGIWVDPDATVGAVIGEDLFIRLDDGTLALFEPTAGNIVTGDGSVTPVALTEQSRQKRLNGRSVKSGSTTTTAITRSENRLLLSRGGGLATPGSNSGYQPANSPATPQTNFDLDPHMIADLPAALAGGSSLVRTITQPAHGFGAGDVLQISGSGTYSKAKADTPANAEVVGIVTQVVDASHFKLCVGGYISAFAGLIADTVYFLSPTTAGTLTALEPSTVGQISKPLLWADTAVSGYLFNMRGMVIAAAGTGGGGSMHLTFGLGVPTALGSDGDLYFESYAGTMYIQSPQAEIPHIVGPVQVNGFTLGTSNNYTITTPLAADCLLIALAFNANTAAEVITGTVTVNVNGQADIRAQIPVTHFTAAPITTPVQHSFGQVMYIDLNGVQLVGATVNITTSVAIDHMHVYSIPLVGSNKSQIMVSSGNLPASQAVAGAGQVTAAYTMGSGLMFSLAWAANTAGTAIPAAPAGFTRIASSIYNTGGISFSTSGLDVMQVPAAFAGTVALGTHATYSYLSMQFAANGAAGSHWRAIIGL